MYDPSTQILTSLGGLSISEVAACLGSASRDLGMLCRNSAINKWARHKPVSIAKLVELTENDKKLVNYGLSIPGTGYGSLTAMIAAVDGGNVSWQYVPPSGGIDVSPFRLLDFNGYCHTARPPMYSIGDTGSMCDGTSVNYGVSFGRILPNAPHELSLDDLRVDGHDVSDTFGEMYFGICLYDYSNHSRCYASTSLSKYKDMAGAGISEIGVTVNGVSTPSSGSRRYIAFPFFSTVSFSSWSDSFLGTLFPVPDVTCNCNFTYQARFTYGGVVGYYLGTETETLHYQFSLHSNVYSSIRVIIDLLDEDGDTFRSPLFDNTVQIPNQHYMSQLIDVQDGLLWNDAHQIRIIGYGAGTQKVIDYTNIVVRGADPYDPPTP